MGLQEDGDDFFPAGGLGEVDGLRDAHLDVALDHPLHFQVPAPVDLPAEGP